MLPAMVVYTQNYSLITLLMYVVSGVTVLRKQMPAVNRLKVFRPVFVEK